MDTVDPITTRQRANTSWNDVAINLNTNRAEEAQLRRVLDHGIVRLIDSMGTDLSVVRSARVSYDSDWRAGDDKGSDKRLINYLIRNGHTSPFEHVVFSFEVKAPLFVLRQWMRHRTWSYNEVSARYTELPEKYYVPDSSKITSQSTDNKQMRTDEEHPDSYHIRDLIELTSRMGFVDYNRLLNLGCPRELARMVLPLNTYSHMFATVNLHNLFKFITLRNHEHAQYEIRVYAEAMLDLIKPIVPVCVEAYLNAHKAA